MIKRYRVVLSLLILAATVTIFVFYLLSHPEIITQLRQINPLYAVAIAMLYLAIIMVLSIVNIISVQICGKKINWRESFNLTGSSSIANFFGPLQGGVGIRAVYFKTKLHIPIRTYGIASLYYYGIYAVLSGLFLLFGESRLRLPLLGGLILGTLATYWYIRRSAKRTEGKKLHASVNLLIKLSGVVLLQLLLITTIYFLELLALGKTVSLAQVISYSGAANFSLFVAITPGAIGIREAFLVFSERLHGVDSATVITANVLDRSIYVVFLALLLIWLLTTHTRVQLNAAAKKETV